jgi:hypothetical protein
MGAAWGLPAGAGHYSGGERTVNTRFAPGDAGGIKEGYGRPGVHILRKLPVPALGPGLFDLDAAQLENVFALGEGTRADEGSSP